MISPIDIATSGYLSVTDSSYYANPEIAIATMGYIIIVVTQTPGGGSSKKRKYYKHDDPYLAQALREDEEIIEIILALTLSDLI